MKLLYLINEPFEGYQAGYRNSLDKLVDAGVLEDYLPFSFIPEERILGDWDKTLEKVLHLIYSYYPDLILFSHVSNRNIPYQFIFKIRSSKSPSPVIGYDERDVYGYFTKPLPKEVINIAKQSDIVFLVAAGSFADRFRNAGCRNVHYLPHSASILQFGSPWEPTDKREFDVVFIANYSPAKIRLLNMPGVNERKELAYSFTRKFGNKFGLYGSGWDEFPNSHGPIAFVEQEKIIRNSWISIGYDHFSEYEYYFSDRLPISLLSKVAYLTKHNKGLENYFTNYEHCIFFESVENAIDICQKLLDLPRAELIKLGVDGHEWVKKNFTEDIRMSALIKQMIFIYKNQSSIQ